jgi:crotonobetainyl-CoA:carnitine CoA-transferase CaiB-like acyl-CoA transferase
MRYTPPLEDGASRLFQAVNRGKKSLTLNFKSDKGRGIMLRLAETADVLLEGFRPGVMERLGMGYETLAQANPRLVYCSLSGYGQSGPYRERAGHDLNYIGLSGLLDLTGTRDGPPTVPGVLAADLGGAVWAAIGIILALVARERTGRGQRVDASLLGGALAHLPLAVAACLGGQPMQRGGSNLTGGAICYHVYEARDGGYVTLGALEPEFWSAFCGAVGREDWVGQQYAPAATGVPVYEELCALFRTRTRQEWMDALAEVDTCFEPVYSVEEALASAPVKALGMLVNGELFPPVQLSAHPAHTSRPAPALGQHTAQLLAELGYDSAAVKRLQEEGVV